MNEDLNQKLLIALRASNAVSADVAAGAAEAQVEISTFDQSYLDFLDEQIKLEPRGPEWTRTLRARRAALGPYCGRPRLHADIRVGNKGYLISVDPESLAIIHIETYQHE
jgi:hypothetical protein